MEKRTLFDGVSHIGPNTPPAGWKSPFRNADGSLVQLYQLLVEDEKEGQIFIGPAMDKAVIESAKVTLLTEMRKGRFREWSNPTVVCVTPLGKAA